MPPLPSGLNFDALVRRLSTKRAGKRLITKAGRLWGYGRTTPSQLPPNRAFSHLKTCADRLAGALPHQPRHFHFAQNGEFPPDVYTFDSFPHVYFEPCADRGGQTLGWDSVAVSGIYTLQTSPDWALTEVGCYAHVNLRLTNFCSQVCSRVERCMAHCMRKDPRRRFTYAFTIEDTRMRLWYCDRAHFVVTEPFNFISVS